MLQIGCRRYLKNQRYLINEPVFLNKKHHRGKQSPFRLTLFAIGLANKMIPSELNPSPCITSCHPTDFTARSIDLNQYRFERNICHLGHQKRSNFSIGILCKMTTISFTGLTENILTGRYYLVVNRKFIRTGGCLVSWQIDIICCDVDVYSTCFSIQ